MKHNFGEISLTWEGNVETHETFPIRLFNQGFDQLQEFVNLPTEGFYSDHLAGLHAYRELFQDDDLNILYGLLASIDVRVNKIGSKKLRIYDDAKVSDQVKKFCDEYNVVDCEGLASFTAKYLQEMDNGKLWKTKSG